MIMLLIVDLYDSFSLAIIIIASLILRFRVYRIPRFLVHCFVCLVNIALGVILSGKSALVRRASVGPLQGLWGGNQINGKLGKFIGI